MGRTSLASLDVRPSLSNKVRYRLGHLCRSMSNTASPRSPQPLRARPSESVHYCIHSVPVSASFASSFSPKPKNETRWRLLLPCTSHTYSSQSKSRSSLLKLQGPNSFLDQRSVMSASPELLRQTVACWKKFWEQFSATTKVQVMEASYDVGNVIGEKLDVGVTLDPQSLTILVRTILSDDGNLKKGGFRTLMLKGSEGITLMKITWPQLNPKWSVVVVRSRR